jgi:hypothetical protein
MIRSVTKIAAAGLFACLVAGTTPVKAQDKPKELPTATVAPGTLTETGFKDPKIALVLNTLGEVVGVITEEPAPLSPLNKPFKPGKPLDPNKVSENPKKIREIGSIAVVAYEGSDCYLVRLPNGTLYVLPAGCTP